MRRAAVLLTVLLASCAGVPWAAEGTEETDRIADVVTRAISHPRQETAEDLARAALATDAGRDGRLEVIEAAELEAAELTDPRARLVLRISLPGSEAGFVRTSPVTACYRAHFSYYGVEGAPRRTGCPAGAVAITPPTIPPTPEIAIPEGFDDTLLAVLQDLPPTPAAPEVAGAVRAAMPPPEVDPVTGLGDVSAPVEARVDGGDVGVALRGPHRSCLLGARIDGRAAVWRPAAVQLQPGELSCDPATALAQQGTRPPH
jgi:hypothetical protein